MSENVVLKKAGRNRKPVWLIEQHFMKIHEVCRLDSTYSWSRVYYFLFLDWNTLLSTLDVSLKYNRAVLCVCIREMWVSDSVTWPSLLRRFFSSHLSFQYVYLNSATELQVTSRQLSFTYFPIHYSPVSLHFDNIHFWLATDS